MDVLEGRSHLASDALDLAEIDHDTGVLIIGGGGAGASAALLARENGAQVLLATKLRFGDANTMMAQGGIQAADKPNDSPTIHYLDAIGGGGFTNVPGLVEAMVMDAPLVIQWLEGQGVMFDKEPEDRPPAREVSAMRSGVPWSTRTTSLRRPDGPTPCLPAAIRPGGEESGSGAASLIHASSTWTPLPTLPSHRSSGSAARQAGTTQTGYGEFADCSICWRGESGCVADVAIPSTCESVMLSTSGVWKRSSPSDGSVLPPKCDCQDVRG